MKKLIDADALERDGWRMFRIVRIDEKTMESQIRKPTDFPTVDAEPVRHGKWKAKSFHEFFCDNCGFSFDMMKCDFLENMNFCPNCGADMREAE